MGTEERANDRQEPGELTAPVQLDSAGPQFEKVVENYAPYLWRALRSMGVPAADAEDLVQEVLLVVYRKLPEFEGESLRSWLYAICLRVASDYRRTARVRREVLPDQLPERSTQPCQPEEVARIQARERLVEVLEQMDEAKRQAFILYEIEQLTLREIAEAMGCPLQTAYSRLESARNLVERAFAKYRSGTGTSGRRP